MESKIALRKHKFNTVRNRIEDVPRVVRVICHSITTFMSISCILPLLIVLSSSLTDEQALRENGYNLIPSKFSLDAYRYIMLNGSEIFHSYFITLVVTVVGTFLALALMSQIGYVLSQRSFPWRHQFSFFIYFTMLFSGGMLPTYILLTKVLELKDTLFALILPICMNATYVLIIRTYMSTSIPEAVVESAKIDGAGEWTCYYKIVLPMSVPVLSTIALFMAIMYWNDWYQSFLYVLNNHNIVPIQLLLKRIETDLEMLSNSARALGGTDLDTMQKTIPSETVRMAIVLIVVIPIMAVYPFFQKFFVKGITVGAVKG